MPLNPGNFGGSLYGLDPYGSIYAPFGVAGATSYGPHFVQVRFTDVIDLTDAAFTDPGNYSISPPLTVLTAVVESADSVVLQTSTQSFVTYTVTVTEAHSLFHVPMLPPLNTATFTGSPSSSAYFSCATGPRRVRVIFSAPMQSAPLLVLANYTVTDLNGNALPIVSAQIEQQIGPALSVVLTLGVSMETSSWYQTILGPAIMNLDDQAPQPPDFDFQFILPVQTVSVPISEFTGEVAGGVFGNPDGLVYFSPSLNVAASNSVIQVEEVDVCSIAYDKYTFPQPFDPSPFYTWSPLGPHTVLEQPGIVLFAGFPRLSEAKFELGFSPTVLIDQVPQAFDGSCSIIMNAMFAPGFVALLNDPAWWMFDGVHTATPPMWICANNLGPIPPGSETIIVLHQAMVGNSTMTVAEPSVVHWAEATITADSILATTPVAPPLAIAANSFMRVARPRLHLGASVSIVGGSTLAVKGLPAPQHYSVSADMVGNATVHAQVKQKWQVSASIAGNASIFVRANRHTPADAVIAADSSATGAATVGPTASAALHGQATVGATATLHHFASTHISVGSTMTATAT